MIDLQNRICVRLFSEDFLQLYNILLLYILSDLINEPSGIPHRMKIFQFQLIELPKEINIVHKCKWNRCFQPFRLLFGRCQWAYFHLFIFYVFSGNANYGELRHGVKIYRVLFGESNKSWGTSQFYCLPSNCMQCKKRLIAYTFPIEAGISFKEYQFYNLLFY